uniref:Putative secreted protein n=1 Tax=Ixodes ricinus TaxID=34613 RepID=A0A090XD07_IXORI
MLRIFSAVTICTILATLIPSKALSAGLADRLFEFFEALGEGDVLYTTKASYEQKNSRVDCVMRTKIRSERTLVRLCMQSKINSPRPNPYTMKITYRRTKNGDVVTEGWSRVPPDMRACGIWRKNIGYDVPEDDDCQRNATQVCGSNWRPISSRNKCGRVPPPEC